MSSIRLKSYEFRREREGTWRELEGLVGKVERGGLKTLSADELLRLPSLYRATVSSLSVARSISLDQNVLTYLESIAARAYFVVYGVRTSTLEGVGAFFLRRFPRAVRNARWHIFAAALFMFLGGATGFIMTLNNEDWFYTFVPAELAGGRSPGASSEELRAVLYHTGGGIKEVLYTFATFLFTHNAAVAMLAFALGFALGLPAILLMFYNGLTIGALAAIYESRGLSAELWAWLSIHGTTELLAVVLCGGAGIVLGSSVAFPGRYSRLENLKRNGRMSSQIVLGAVVLLFVASLLEGFARQLVVDVTERYLVAVGALICWTLYFLRTGKSEFDGGDV
jgi:uncharacterized membrane protein SpoIIM required for sporulation